MPGATTAKLVDPVWLMRSKAMMMPHTVPNRPTNGAMLAVVARNDTRRSSLLISTTDARIRARSTAVRLFSVGRPAGGRGLGPLLASGAAWRSCAVNSAYPDWKRPTSGLSLSERHTACTSENLLLRRKTSRNCAVCLLAARYVHSLYRMMPHEMIDSSSSSTRTPWEIGLDSRTRRTMLVLDVVEPSDAAPPCACMSKAISGLPSVRKTGLRETAV